MCSALYAEPAALPIGLNGEQAPYENILAKLRTLDVQTVKPTNTNATRTLEQLRNSQLKWRDAIKSFHVDFDYARLRKQKLAKEIAAEQQNKVLPEDFRLTLSFAYKNQKKYSFYQQVPLANEGAHPIYKYAFNGQECRTHEPKRALGQIHPEQVSGLEGNAGHYMDMINIPVGPNAQKILLTPSYIPTALQMSTFYRVLPKLENVDGFDCHVVTSGWDTFWLDDANGGCMRRRVLFRKTGEDDPGCLHYVFACKKFVEAYPGVWLPQECNRLDFGTQMDPPALRGVLAATNVVVAKQLKVNNVPDSRFEIDFPPGTQVQDLVKHKAFIVPGGIELLDKAMAEALPIVNNQVMAPDYLQSQFRARILWGINLVAIFALVAVVIYRRAISAKA
jgi:hypothetical protein